MDKMALILIAVACLTLCSFMPNTSADKLITHNIEDHAYWRELGKSELRLGLRQKWNTGTAKNVIVFIGDGMGPSTITASRIFKGQTKDHLGESSTMAFEHFPVTGISKTYSVNKQTPDSASTATAMFSGVKTISGMLGLDMQAPHNACNPHDNEKAKLSGMMDWAQTEGKDTGIVTTTRLTDATPAATYAHINYRYWECDSKMPPNLRTCVKDIARQMVEDTPGRNFKVILGGGRSVFGHPSPYDEKMKYMEKTCYRNDSIDLVNQWLQSKSKFHAKYVTTAEELKNVRSEETDYLLGLFSPSHLNFVGENEPTRPSLSAMTKKAIDILEKNPKGFFLMVEGGRIDQAHHKNYARLALMETVELNEAIETAMGEVNLRETLIIVTSDHSHPMTMAGYSDRGTDILGVTEREGRTYEMLTYANGPGYDEHHPKIDLHSYCLTHNCTQEEIDSAYYERNVTNIENRTDAHYRPSSAFYLSDDTHGGEDVAIYAQGPMAHLLSGVHEQSYIGHVISCASCVGPQKILCCTKKSGASAAFSPTYGMSFLLSFSLIVKALIGGLDA